MAKRRNLFPIVMVAAGGIFLLGAIIIVLTSNNPGDTAVVTPNLSTQVALSDIPRVSLADAKNAFDQKTAVFVDVRDAGSYATSHIQNALSIPLTDLPNRLSSLNPNAWIITVCT